MNWCHPLFSSIGRLNENVALPSGLFSAQISPPRASIILFEINNPNPVPNFEMTLIQTFNVYEFKKALTLSLEIAYELFLFL